MPHPSRRRARPGLLLAGACLFSLAAASAQAAAPVKTASAKVSAPKAPAPIDSVNPFVGTAAHGHTYPGATVPFGLVQLSPDTPLQGWDGCSGYHYSDSAILGFSHTHLSGTGVGGLGDVLLMPTVGGVRLDAGTPGDGYASRFSHDGESAKPGYYKVFLQTPQVMAELTATARCGVHRYTFPRTDAAHIVLDLAHGINNTAVSETLRVENATTLSGSRVSDGWGGRRAVFFVLEFSRPFGSLGIEQDGQRLAAGTQNAGGKSVKAVATYATAQGEAITVKVGISGTGVDGARKNLSAEVGPLGFDGVRALAARQWGQALNAVQIQTPDPKARRTFYTNLYQSYLSPVLYNDADGAYRGFDHKTHANEGFENYTTFSLWDIFRAESPLLTILQPARVPDMARSLLAEYRQSGTGLMPIWPLWDNETYCMIGYHSAPVIADAYLKGLMPSDAEAAYQALRATALRDNSGLRDYKASGYVYSEVGGQKQSVSRTLEYAYDDWCIAEMAQKLGHKDDAAEFFRRAANYRNVYDRTTTFMRGRRPDGAWRAPFNPKQLVWADYTEANAWQYSWGVMQDVPGLIRIMGGDGAFVQKLDGLFSAKSDVVANISDISGLIGQYAHGNEPVHHVAYLYNYAGAAPQTQKRVRQVMASLYDDTPAGQCGNDDCGQMSAWYVFSALGFYPVNPVGGVYVIGSPLVSRATIQLDRAHYGGHTFTVIAQNNSARNVYIQSATLNGAPLRRTWFTQTQLAAGGTLKLVMGPEPNPAWGRAPADRPPTGMPAGVQYAALPAPSVPLGTVRLALPIRVVCGSDTPVGDFVPDPNMADGGVNGSAAAVDTSAPHAAPAAVYQSERYGDDFTYSFPVPPGRLYTVRLHFAEIFDDQAGLRVEDIDLNGKTVLPGFDIFREAGGTGRAVVREFSPVAPDARGLIRVRVRAAKGSPDQNAKISGIEILEAPQAAAR